MTGLAFLLFLAAIAFGSAQRFRLPLIPLLLLGGVGLSLTGLLSGNEGEPGANRFLYDVLQLGLTFLVFAFGIELNPQRFGPQRKAVPWVGYIQFIFAGMMGFSLARLLGFEPITALYLAFALSASSTLVVIQHLKRSQQMFEPFGRLVIGVLLLQDMLMILLIIILSRASFGLFPVLLGVMQGLTLLGLAWLVQKRFLPWLVIEKKLDDELLLLTFLAILFTFTGIAYQMQLPPVAGAFLAGFSLSGYPINGIVRGLIHSLTDFFLALFFITLGAVITVPEPLLFAKALILASFVVILTPPVVAIVAEWTGLPWRASIESGLYLAQTSEFSLILGLYGVSAGHISIEIFSVLALVGVVTMTATPFIATDQMTQRLLHFHPARRTLTTEGTIKDHILILGFGTGGMWVVKPILAEGYKVMVVDDDPAVIEQLQMTGIPCIRGDGSDEKILAKAGAHRARLIMVAMRRIRDAEKVLRIVRDVPVMVRLFEDSEAERVKNLGGIPILNSSAAADTFMEWFAKTHSFSTDKPGDETSHSSLRSSL